MESNKKFFSPPAYYDKFSKVEVSQRHSMWDKVCFLIILFYQVL